MTSDETLLLQALKLKQLRHEGYSGNFDLVEQAMLHNPDAIEIKEKMRNICAFVSTQMFDDIEQMCSLLNLSKRQFLQMAVIDLMHKANKIIHETKALEELEQ